MKIRFSGSAVGDIHRLWRFLAEKDFEAAKAALSRLEGAIGNLAHAPRMGRPVPDFSGDVREFVFGRYVVRYLVSRNELTILRVWHAREDRFSSGA